MLCARVMRGTRSSASARRPTPRRGLLDQVTGAPRVQQADQRHAGGQHRQLVGQRPLHLRDHVGAGNGLGCGRGDRRAGRGVRGVGVEGAGARAGLDHHRRAGFHQLRDVLRHQRNALLAFGALGQNGNTHEFRRREHQDHRSTTPGTVRRGGNGLLEAASVGNGVNGGVEVVQRVHTTVERARGQLDQDPGELGAGDRRQMRRTSPTSTSRRSAQTTSPAAAPNRSAGLASSRSGPVMKLGRTTVNGFGPLTSAASTVARTRRYSFPVADAPSAER